MFLPRSLPVGTAKDPDLKLTQPLLLPALAELCGGSAKSKGVTTVFTDTLSCAGIRKLAVSILRLTMALVTRLAVTILAPRPRRLEAKLAKPKLSRPGLKPFVPDRSLERLLRRSLVTPCFLACLG